jgi:hypothetical protein
MNLNSVPKIIWLKKTWNLKHNPFPAQGIARLGGDDLKENGLLFNDNVQPEKLAEAAEKFVLGSVYSGLKFGYLWSLGTGVNSDARGFAKSVMMQHLVEKINQDFGKTIFLQCGLDESDAEDAPICAVLASFDMANAKSLNAVFYEAARYGCRFQQTPETPTLFARIRRRLVQRVGSEKTKDLESAMEEAQANLRGRTLGPPVQEFLEVLCSGDSKRVQQYVDGVKPATRTRNGANYFATFLLMIKASGINHVLLCCDQLEDFASTATARQKRTVETERFRDYLLELQPMCDMLSCVLTLHPRATLAIGEMWRLADLPSYDYSREENRHSVVVLESINAEKAQILVTTYVAAARANSARSDDHLFPFTSEAVDVICKRADGKPRDILRKAFALVERGSEENWDLIDGERATKVLDSFTETDDDDLGPLDSAGTANRAELWN